METASPFIRIPNKMREYNESPVFERGFVFLWTEKEKMEQDGWSYDNLTPEQKADYDFMMHM
jgi:hypothetical protein